MTFCTHCGARLDGAGQFCAACGAATSGPFVESALPYFPAAPATADERPPVANYGWRVLGYLIDTIIVAVFTRIPSASLNLSFYPTVAIGAVANFAYWSYFISAQGATLGMRAVKTRCVDRDRITRVPRERAILRAGAFSALALLANLYHLKTYANPTAAQTHRTEVALALYFVLALPLALDLLWPLWNKDRQTLHDRLARTVVIRPKESPR